MTKPIPLKNRNDWAPPDPKDDLALLESYKTPVAFDPGQTIFAQGTPCRGIYFLEEGIVAIRKQDQTHHSLIVRMAHSGEFLGYRAFLAQQSYTASAEAISAVRGYFVSRDHVVRLLKESPALSLSFSRKLAEELQEAEDLRLKGVTLPVRARLAHLLLGLKDRFATVNDDGDMTIELPLSRQDLAAMIGTRPETIARSIRALEADKVAFFEGRRVIVRDLDALLDEVEQTA